MKTQTRCGLLVDGQTILHAELLENKSKLIAYINIDKPSAIMLKYIMDSLTTVLHDHDHSHAVSAPRKTISGYKLYSSPKAARNRMVLGLYALGYSIENIRSLLEADGVKLAKRTIYDIIYSEDAEAFLNELEGEQDKRLKLLYEDMVDVLARGMTHMDIGRVAIPAAALYAKVTGRMNLTVEHKHSAEDVVAALMAEYEKRKGNGGMEQIE